MKKLGDFLDKPITWRGYIRLSIICMIISVIYVLLYIGWLFGIPSELINMLRNFKDSIMKTKSKF